MLKKILSLLLIGLLVFNITVVNYKRLPVYAVDGGLVVGGAIYGADVLAKIIVGTLAATGGAYIYNEKKEDIKEFTGDVANSYIQYLDDEKNASVYTSQQFSRWLDKSYDAIRYGTTQAINITTDMYKSFKAFINEVLQPLPPSGTITFPSKPNIIIAEGVAPYLAERYGSGWYRIISVDYYMTNGNLDTAYVSCSSSGQYILDGIDKITDTVLSDGRHQITIRYREHYRDNENSKYYKNLTFFTPASGGTYTIYQKGCPYIGNEVTESGSDIPSWRVPIENHDLKIKSIDGTKTLDNYDVIDLGGTYVDSKTGNLVGDRTITIPSDDIIDRIWDRYINGEITDNQMVKDVNDVIGVTGVDTSIEGVTDIPTGITLPLDTPIWGDTTGDTTGDTVGDLINSDSNVNDSTVTGFPDLTEIFPFCIPFDVLRLLKLLRTSAECPHFEIPIKIGWFNVDYTMVVDFEQFTTLSHITRTFLAIIWVIFLILATRRLIRA